MNKLNEILQELGISKVKLAKYLGVSRQMIYNYLELDNLNKWPKEKKILLFKLLDITDGSDKALSKIKITSDYIMEVENKLNQSLKDTIEFDNMAELSKLTKEEQLLFSNITNLLKDRFTEDVKHDENIATFKYIFHILQSLDNVDIAKFFLAYVSKAMGLTDPNEFAYSEEKQFMFEGIVHSAITLYTTGSANTKKAAIISSRARFVREIEEKKEEKLTRTMQLNTIKLQALRELNYTEINSENASEVFEKITEIESRKI